jgi:predicted secreted protein
MKLKWLPIGLLIGTLLIMTACSRLPNSVSVDESSSGKQVKVAINGSITVMLDSNATTGYSWELTGIQEGSDTQIL